MISIGIHKPYIKKFAFVYLKGLYFKIFALNFVLFGVTIEFWKKQVGLQRNVKGFTKAFGRNAIQFLISVEGYNQ